MDRQSVDANGAPNVIRLYGEVYGGQYGGDNANGAVKTQREPNYCPFNDFAFFDIYVDEIKMPVLEMIERTEIGHSMNLGQSGKAGVVILILIKSFLQKCLQIRIQSPF